MGTNKLGKFRDKDGYSSEELFNFLRSKGLGLEIGCGEGRNLNYFANKDLQVIGIDISMEHLEKVRKGIEVLQADAYQLPFENEHFDWVLCSEVLEHLDDPDTAIKEVRRVLKYGGIALFTCPTLNVPCRGIIPIYRKMAGIPQHSYNDHVNVFNTKQVEEMLGHYFEINKVKHVDFLTILQRRLRTGYALEVYLSSLAGKMPPLKYLSGGAWFKVRKGKVLSN